MARHGLSSPVPSALTVEGTTLYRPEVERIRSAILELVSPTDPEREGLYRAALQVLATEVTLRYSHPTRHSAVVSAESIVREALA